MLLQQGSGVADDLRIENRTAFGVVERRNGHAPRPLTRDAPIRSRLDSAVYAALTPIRNPLYFADDIKCFCSKGDMGNRTLIVHLIITRLSYRFFFEPDLNEPLVHRAEDGRRLAAPA